MMNRLRRIASRDHWPRRGWSFRAGPALLVLATVLLGIKLAFTIDAARAPEAEISSEPEDSSGPELPEPAAGPTTSTGPPPPGMSSPPSAPAPTAAALTEPGPFSTAPTPVEQQLLVDLSRRRALLDARADELELQERLVRMTADELKLQIETLERLKTEIGALIDQHEAGQEARISRLVKIYETMKPKAAAAIFDRLDMPVLLELASRMKETKTSDVMARMRPDRAEALTKELAHRRRLGELLAARLSDGQRGGR